ncbi:hypothetical protein D3C86_1377260 [compost metagenome]
MAEHDGDAPLEQGLVQGRIAETLLHAREGVLAARVDDDGQLQLLDEVHQPRVPHRAQLELLKGREPLEGHRGRAPAFELGDGVAAIRIHRDDGQELGTLATGLEEVGVRHQEMALGGIQLAVGVVHPVHGEEARVIELARLIDRTGHEGGVGRVLAAPRLGAPHAGQKHHRLEGQRAPHARRDGAAGVAGAEARQVGMKVDPQAHRPILSEHRPGQRPGRCERTGASAA